MVWLAVTLLTRPEPMETLVAFYRRTRPSFAGWKPVAAHAPEVKPSGGHLSSLLDWIAGCVLIYATLFGVGKLLLKETGTGLALLGLAALAAAVIYRHLSGREWKVVGE